MGQFHRESQVSAEDQGHCGVVPHAPGVQPPGTGWRHRIFGNPKAKLAEEKEHF